MRLTVTGDTIVERLALRLGLVPRPAVEAFGGAALWGVLVASVRLGLTERLARSPASAADLASRLELDTAVVAMMLDCLASTGHVRRSAGRYRLTRSARRWLDPAAPHSVANFVAAAADYGDWWAGLAEAARTGAGGLSHDRPADDSYWRRYLLGQLDLARLSAAEVASRIPLRSQARHVLDVGGGHGWYSVAICRRFPAVRSTVLDLPGAVGIGRQIVAEAGLADRIAYTEGDVATAELPPGQDAIFVFNLLHHLTTEQIESLFARAAHALAPDGVLCVLDGFAEPGPPAAAAAHVSLFMFLSSGSRINGEAELRRWYASAGLSAPVRVPVRRLPGLTLHLGRKPGGRGA